MKNKKKRKKQGKQEDKGGIKVLTVWKITEEAITKKKKKKLPAHQDVQDY